MICYSIRKSKWRVIMDDYPDYYQIIKQKCFTFYYRQIYKPLLKLKEKETSKL